MARYINPSSKCGRVAPVRDKDTNSEGVMRLSNASQQIFPRPFLGYAFVETDRSIPAAHQVAAPKSREIDVDDGFCSTMVLPACNEKAHDAAIEPAISR
jgi:hypothetical protein